MTYGSVISAMIRKVPLHTGHTVIRRRSHHIKHTFESLSPSEWGDKFVLASFIMFFVIPFALNFLHGCLAILWHNEFPNLCIVLMAVPSEYTVISHKIMSGSGYLSCKFA